METSGSHGRWPGVSKREHNASKSALLGDTSSHNPGRSSMVYDAEFTVLDSHWDSVSTRDFEDAQTYTLRPAPPSRVFAQQVSAAYQVPIGIHQTPKGKGRVLDIFI